MSYDGFETAMLAAQSFFLDLVVEGMATDRASREAGAHVWAEHEVFLLPEHIAKAWEDAPFGCLLDHESGEELRPATAHELSLALKPDNFTRSLFTDRRGLCIRGDWYRVNGPRGEVKLPEWL